MSTFPYKNAADYGFMPGQDADENSAALQKAVLGGGTVVIGQPGIYDLSGTILLDSYTKLEFGAGVFIRRQPPKMTGTCAYAFVNRGAYTRTYNTDITITGLHLICNGNEAMGDASGLPKRDDGLENECDHIMGLRGQVSFFYCNNVVIRDFVCPDLMNISYGIQISTFENFLLENARIEGKKDGVHLGRGRKFTIRDCKFRTFDDPIALNAYDYTSSNPQLGWIEDGLIENCYDLHQDATVGYFCRILGGCWKDWKPGMMIRHSDAVVHNGRVYRVQMQVDGKKYTSVTPPEFEHGFQVLDGINWYMCQDDGAIYSCGCRNIHFKDIFLQKKRSVAIAINFEDNDYAHSIYPGAELPVQEDIVLESVFFEADLEHLLRANTPVNSVKVINSVIRDCDILLNTLDETDDDYGHTDVLLLGNTYRSDTDRAIIACDGNRTASVKIAGSVVQGDFRPRYRGNIDLLASDIPLIKE
ncbi:MAG: hypothetical protein IJ480_01880 [Clostridia bacterium]|nr:hypothetical protein [Clostridia bacterium]